MLWQQSTSAFVGSSHPGVGLAALSKQIVTCTDVAAERQPWLPCRAEEAEVLWRQSKAAFSTSSHPGVRHAALRCAGATLGTLQRQTPASEAGDAREAAAAGDQHTAAATASQHLAMGPADWLLEAAEGGSGAAEAPEIRLAVADAIAATGKNSF